MSTSEVEGKYGVFIRAATRLGAAVVADEPLAPHTTFRIGGPADLYVPVNDRTLLERLTTLAAEHSIPTTVLGGGSNVLISDAGVRGLVIANQTRNYGAAADPSEAEQMPPTARDQERRPGPRLIADSGVLLAGLARWAIKAGLAGLEWAVSVPGTVGGAVIGNAGAHGGQVADNLAWALVAYPGQRPRTITCQELGYSYRDSLLKRQVAGRQPALGAPVVLAAAFDMLRGDPEALAGRADAFLAKRRATQPVEPSAGSIFRNPPGDYAGRLVEAVGLKGYRLGGAGISPRHANFIVNLGGASAAEVVALMDLTRSRVYQAFGIELRPEIVFLGDWDDQPPLAPVT